ncbi:unnamed protein product [Symbiodinium sp. CCMP2592]|nr:unnamed protein product [Symbiodinium sp. CCMP2592]
MGRSRSRSGSKPRDGGGGKREKGTINTWNNDRQFGFVSCDSGRQDLFTHAEYITDTNARYDAKTRGLRRGDRISFEVEEPQGNKKSQQAVNVEILELAGLSMFACPRCIHLDGFGDRPEPVLEDHNKTIMFSRKSIGRLASSLPVLSLQAAFNPTSQNALSSNRS